MVKVDPEVIVKLVIFSVLLFILPVGVLQASLHGYFDVAITAIFGTVSANLRQLFGAVLAVLTVNAVVIAYVVSAYNERPTTAKLVNESKKAE